jgi:NADH-quinone oxidoreductase subunit E
MTRPGDEDDRAGAARDALFQSMMVNPVAAMTATTVIGLGMASQFTGLMLGMMQNAVAQAKAMSEAAAGLPVTAEPARAKPGLTVVPKPALKTPEPQLARAAAKAPAPKAAADDLKAISGVGPKLEQVLNGMGYRRHADIAAWTAAEVERIDAELGLDGRIARDGWVEQAKALATARIAGKRIWQS